MDPAFHSAIKAGITSAMIGLSSANVVGGQFAFIKLWGRCLDDMIVLAPRRHEGCLRRKPQATYGESNEMPSTRMGIAAMLREELTEAKRYYLAKEAAEREGKDYEFDFERECWIPVFKKGDPA